MADALELGPVLLGLELGVAVVGLPLSPGDVEVLDDGVGHGASVVFDGWLLVEWPPPGADVDDVGGLVAGDDVTGSDPDVFEVGLVDVAPGAAGVEPVADDAEFADVFVPGACAAVVPPPVVPGAACVPVRPGCCSVMVGVVATIGAFCPGSAGLASTGGAVTGRVTGAVPFA